MLKMTTLVTVNKTNKIKFIRKLHSKIHNQCKRKKSSNRWISRHVNDLYVELATQQGYRSRASYKLIEIDQRFQLFGKGDIILDLGASPGSWSQVAQELTATKGVSNKIVAVDLLDMIPLNHVNFINADIYADNIIEEIKLFQQHFQIVLSDIAPNTTGHKNIDHLRIIDIAEQVLEITKKVILPNGHLVIKIFQGAHENDFITGLRKYFKRVVRFKPQASRKESSEIYLIAQNYKHATES